MALKTLGIIPARFASTRLPGKLLIPIQGKTLLQRTFENSSQAKTIDQLLIATDDERVYAHAASFGAQPIMTSISCPSGTDRLAEVLLRFPEYLKAEAIINIQADEPCIDPKAIELAIKTLLEDPQAVMSTLITPLTSPEEASSSSIVKCVKDFHNHAIYFSRAQIPSNKMQAFNHLNLYYKHIGLYVYRPDFLLHYASLPPTPLQQEEDLEQLKAIEHGFRIKVAVTDSASIGVDTPEDLLKIERWLCKQNISS